MYCTHPGLLQHIPCIYNEEYNIIYYIRDFGSLKWGQQGEEGIEVNCGYGTVARGCVVFSRCEEYTVKEPTTTTGERSLSL